MDVKFRKLTRPSTEIAECLQKWENDPALIPLIRPNRNKDALETKEVLTAQDLEHRLEHNHTFLIYLGDQLIGEMDYQIDPKHLYKKATGTAWIGIIIGEEIARGKGIGHQALQYLEEEIRKQGLIRIELGVFEFNTNAVKPYQTAGYREIGRIPDFTYWQGKMWQDIRMEKYV
jgi:RimJ/RimL family protein N-acetyltransferase